LSRGRGLRGYAPRFQGLRSLRAAGGAIGTIYTRAAGALSVEKGTLSRGGRKKGAFPGTQVKIMLEVVLPRGEGKTEGAQQARGLVADRQEALSTLSVEESNPVQS